MKVRRGAIAAIAILLAGCDAGYVVVSGRVTSEGIPVSAGSITFEPAGGIGPTAGGEIKDGSYTLGTGARVLPGKKRVRILATRKTGRTIPAGTSVPRGTMVEEIHAIDVPLEDVELTAGKPNDFSFEIGHLP